jgi:hypothetical protein
MLSLLFTPSSAATGSASLENELVSALVLHRLDTLIARDIAQILWSCRDMIAMTVDIRIAFILASLRDPGFSSREAVYYKFPELWILPRVVAPSSKMSSFFGFTFRGFKAASVLFLLS